MRLPSIFVLVFQLVYGQYLEKTNKNVMYMNLCAGANNPTVCVPQHFSYEVLKQFTVSCTDLIWSGTCEATVMVSEVDSAIGLFFRGPTGSYTSFLSGGAAKLTAMSQTAFGSSGNVGADYATAFSRLWNDQGLGAYMQQTWADYCDYVLILSGHSVGSCLAQMAGVTLAPMNHWSPAEMIYYGYGTPRCGNPTFASAVDSSIGIRYRVNWKTDYFPKYPAAGANWQHCCNSVYMSSGLLGMTTTQCSSPEDSKCLAGTKAADHVTYWTTTQKQYDSLTCGSSMTFSPDP